MEMPSTSRPRNYTSGPNGSGRSAPNAPMSERQQMALVMQMHTSNQTTQSQAELSPGCSPGTTRSRDRNERGETALHVAAIKGDVEGVKKQLELGMPIDVVDFAGWTPLHEACIHGHYIVALFLVKSGANIAAKGMEDDTPLHDAAYNGHLKIARMLVERGADPAARNGKGKTPVDVAAAAVYNYLVNAASGRSQQSMRKTSESKKSLDDHDDTSTASGSSAKSTSKPPEDDVYEFKTTPKDSSSSSSGDDKSDSGKGSDKDEKSDDAPIKRSYSDVEGDNDDDLKRKKRKDTGSESSNKDANKSLNGSRTSQQRQEKSSKTASTGLKNAAIPSKVATSLERKSPSGSPKPSTSKSTDSDPEADDKGSGDSFGLAGPKVPPLKIVIPQSDQETGNRNGKNTSARSHAALPYVVPSSSNSNDSADKESVSSRCTSPSDSTKSVDDKKSTAGMTNEEQRQQRVLRSSHRGGQSVDRGSNNSSPQMQSSSPSPAPITSSTSSAATVTTSVTSAASGDSAEPTAKSTRTDEMRLSHSANTTTLAPGGANTGSSASPNNVSMTVEADAASNVPSPSASSTSSTKDTQPSAVELHPRKRKIRASKDENKQNTNLATNPQTQTATIVENSESVENQEAPHPHDQPITNCYQMYIDIRTQINRKHRSLIPVQPKPPQGFKDYLLNRRSYVLANKSPTEPNITFPANIMSQLKDLFMGQDKERHKLKMQHMVEKEKLVLAVEQEILRVHGRAGRALANQAVPFSACTILKDDEVYNIITPEQEEKDRNARSRYNGRLFLSWLQDVDDKWEKIKEAMVLRHHNEAESLHAVQKMDWEWKMKELTLCEFKAQPIIEDSHVPMVHVSDDFDLLP